MLGRLGRYDIIHFYFYDRNCICFCYIIIVNLLSPLAYIHMHKVGIARGLLQRIVYHRLRCKRTYT